MNGRAPSPPAGRPGGREGKGGPDHVPQPGPPWSPGTFLPCGMAAFPTNLPDAGSGEGGGGARPLRSWDKDCHAPSAAADKAPAWGREAAPVTVQLSPKKPGEGWWGEWCWGLTEEAIRTLGPGGPGRPAVPSRPLIP